MSKLKLAKEQDVKQNETVDETVAKVDEISAKDVEQFGAQCTKIFEQVSRDVIGQKEVVEGTIVAMIAGGNVLLEGVPGVGKTRLVRSLGRVFELPFKRIQFTPDLMPADVTGTNIIVKDENGNSSFQFQEGPIFSNIILADEINRATPKTQSALLEAMQEHTVTVMGTSRKLSEPFFVLATQNPIEQDGTYPLPEAQMDRFMFKLIVPNPSLDELMQIVDMQTPFKPTPQWLFLTRRVRSCETREVYSKPRDMMCECLTLSIWNARIDTILSSISRATTMCNDL